MAMMHLRDQRILKPLIYTVLEQLIIVTLWNNKNPTSIEEHIATNDGALINLERVTW